MSCELVCPGCWASCWPTLLSVGLACTFFGALTVLLLWWQHEQSTGGGL